MAKSNALVRKGSLNFFLLLLEVSFFHSDYFAIAQTYTNYVDVVGNGTIEMFYQGYLNDIVVSTVHNNHLNILQYLVKWEYGAPDDYTVAASLTSPCETNTTFLEYLNVSVAEFYIPPTPDYDFRVQENCSYDIEVKVHGHSLNILSYIPDVNVRGEINSTIIETRTLFLNQIYNVTLGKVQYILKWKGTVPSNGYTVKISPNDCKNYYNNETYEYNATKITEELYIPTDISSFALYNNCSYFIEISADGRTINAKNYISGNVDVKNIALHTIYNESISKIQYLLTWMDTAPNLYSINIVPESNASYCQKHYDSHDLNSHVTQIYIPPTSDYDFELEGNCTYNITIKSEGMLTTIKHYIPECVGLRCNCKLLGPNPVTNTTPIIEHHNGKLNISWSFAESKENNITDIGFYLILDPTCNSNEHTKKVYSETPLQTMREKSYAVLNVTGDVIDDKYCLSVSFNNTYHCTYSHAYDFIEQVPTQKTELRVVWAQWLIALILSMLLAIMGYCCFHSYRSKFVKKRKSESSNQTNRQETFTGTRKKETINLLYVEKEILDGTKDSYEIPRARIVLIKEIGKGAFGEVLLAHGYIDGLTRYVAVKKLREKASHEECEDFSAEIEILKKIGYHQNIVRLVGCCTLEEPYMMIMEYVPCGDLKRYLLDLRNHWHKNQKYPLDVSVFTSRSSAYIIPDTPDSPITPKSKTSVKTEYVNIDSIDSPRSTTSFDFEIERVLDHKELQSFALQIAKGMAHLEQIPITHRDLAARNILISEQKVLKISDFGLSRTGPYINSKTKKLPLRWMALESIEDHIYDNKSDVWSFAIVLWEIATLGGFPYEKIPDSMLLYYLQNGKRLSRPEICTDDLYCLMLRCWSREKNLRPSFAELVELLDVKRRRVYVDFNQLNPMYVFPPASNDTDFSTSSIQENAPKYLECA